MNVVDGLNDWLKLLLAKGQLLRCVRALVLELNLLSSDQVCDTSLLNESSPLPFVIVHLKRIWKDEFDIAIV